MLKKVWGPVDTFNCLAYLDTFRCTMRRASGLQRKPDALLSAMGACRIFTGGDAMGHSSNISLLRVDSHPTVVLVDKLAAMV